LQAQLNSPRDKSHPLRAASSVGSLVTEFWQAPDEARFNQRTIAAVRNCSEALLERERWAGTSGPPFIKDGRRVQYRKLDVVKWLNGHQTFRSTSEYPEPQAA
jgi:hypothetical protein